MFLQISNIKKTILYVSNKKNFAKCSCFCAIQVKNVMSHKYHAYPYKNQFTEAIHYHINTTTYSNIIMLILTNNNRLHVHVDSTFNSILPAHAAPQE